MSQSSAHRSYCNTKRGLSFDDYPRRCLLAIEIGPAEYYRDVWDYSEGDTLLYDPSMLPLDGDIVLTKVDDVYRVKVYQPVAHPKQTAIRPTFTDDGSPLDPEPEIIEAIDKTIVGVVMFDIRRRSMPCQK